jgi:hypothetical protein
MKKLGIAALIALALFAGRLVAPATEAFAQPVLDEDNVSQLSASESSDAAAPVRVVFGRHAAIYLLPRDDPNFAAWFDILARSLKERTRVRFINDAAGPRLTLVEPAQ